MSTNERSVSRRDLFRPLADGIIPKPDPADYRQPSFFNPEGRDEPAGNGKRRQCDGCQLHGDRGADLQHLGQCLRDRQRRHGDVERSSQHRLSHTRVNVKRCLG